jgi:hypothetical protein
MELYVFNSSRQLAGIVESFEYLRWTRRYSQCGSFELKAIATPENTALLKAGNILWKSDDEEADDENNCERKRRGHRRGYRKFPPPIFVDVSSVQTSHEIPTVK